MNYCSRLKRTFFVKLQKCFPGKISIFAVAAIALLILSGPPVYAQSLSDLDLNNDGVINSLDIFELRSCFNAPAACNPQADFNGDGVIGFPDYQILVQSYGQTVPQIELSIAGEDEVVVLLDGSTNILYSVALVVHGPGIYNLQYEESEDPNNGGLNVVNDASQVFPTILHDSKVILINETITGLAVGEYTLTKRVTLASPALTAEHTVLVRVVDSTDIPELLMPGSEPSGIPINTPTVVTFSVLLTNTSRVPVTVEIRKVGPAGEDLGLMATLADDGTGPDGAAGDNVYTGINAIVGTTPGFITYIAFATFPEGDTVQSPVSELVVTNVLTELPAFNVEEQGTEIDPATNTKVVTGQVIVILAEGVTPEEAQSAVETLGYEVLGYDHALGTMLVGFPTTLFLYNVVADLVANPLFDTAEPNGIDVVSEFTPNDPNYGTQWGFTKSRADEAWVISRGKNILVGMLDTGADLDHPDLASNLWKSSFTITLPFIGTITFNKLGFDMVDGDNIPEDADGHGTHVAGTIAAVTNNSTQVAGMAPNAKVMVIRNLGPGGGAHSQFADGVRKAADMGVRVISYSGGGSHSATKQNAVNYAVNKGVLFIAAAGNDNTSSTAIAFPGAYANVMAIGSTTSTDGRSGFSNFGNWVSMAAPGSDILSTWLNGGTNTISGTSMATPHVSGAAALVMSRFPSLTAAQVRQRLEKTAKPLPAALQQGAGRLDAFNAVFNGNFEIGDMSGWNTIGTASSVTSLGPLVVQDGARMAFISTGPAATNLSTRFSQSFVVQDDVSSIPVQFTYNFVTEEYPEWVGTMYNDCTAIELKAPDGSVHTLATESVNASSFVPVGGITLPGGDDTVGMTGWKTLAIDIPVTEGPGEYQIFITDKGDDIYDSVLLLDDIRFKASVPLGTPLINGSCP